MRSAPDTSFNESRTPGCAPSYQLYAKIEVACRLSNTYRRTGLRVQEQPRGDRPSRPSRTPEPHASRDLRNGRPDPVANGIDLLFKYERFWTAAKMQRSAPAGIMILGLIRDLQKVSQRNDWFFEDRAPFLAYKVDLLLRRHQPRGLRHTTPLGYKRYQCAPVRAQALMFELQEYHQLGQSTGPYAYSSVAQGAPIDLVQLATIYQTGLGKSDTTTSTRKFRGSHVFIRPMKGTSTFFLLKTPVI